MAISALLLHKPPAGQDPDLQILLPLGGVATLGSPIDIGAAASRFDGTYTPVLLRGDSGTGTRTVTVTFTQTVGGVAVGDPVVSTRTYGAGDFFGPFLMLETVTLPCVKVPEDCTTSSVQVDVATTGGTPNTWLDLMLLDTFGQTIMLRDLPSGTTAVYVDGPSDDAGPFGHIYASASDRSAAFSVLHLADVPGGVMSFEPGDNRLLQVSPQGVLDIDCSYFSRWLYERTA